MLKIALFIISLAIIVASFSWLSGNEGTVNIQWLDYNIKTNTTIAFSILLLIIAAGLFILEFFIYLFNLPKKFKNKVENNRKDDLLRNITQGFSAILTHDIDSANKSSQKAIKLLQEDKNNAPLVNILAATTASLNENQQQADHYYNKMLDNKSTKLAGIKGLISSKMANNDYTHAIGLAAQAVDLQKDNAKNILNLLFLYKKSQKWEDGSAFLQKYSNKKWSKITNNTVSLEQEKAFLLFMQAVELSAKQSYNLASSLFLQSHHTDYSFIAATLEAAQTAQRQDKNKLAMSICIKGWKYNPHPEIAELYFNIYPDAKAAKKLNFAKKLAESNPNNAESYKVLAKQYLAVDNIEKAIKNAEYAIAQRQSADLYQLMIEIVKTKYLISSEAEIETLDNDSNNLSQEEQIDFWQEKADNAKSIMAWKCNDCGNVSGNNWQAECPSCGNLGHISWHKISTQQFANNITNTLVNNHNIATDLVITQ